MSIFELVRKGFRGPAPSNDNAMDTDQRSFSILPTCRSSYVAEGEQAVNKCCCTTDIDKLVLGLNGTVLPKYLINMLRRHGELSIHELVIKIKNAGAEPIENSGCRNRMLLQLRDIILEKFGTKINAEETNGDYKQLEEERNSVDSTDRIDKYDRYVYGLRTLQTCSTSYLEYRLNEHKCKCTINVCLFLSELPRILSKNSMDLLRASCELNIIQLINRIINSGFGGKYLISGCKNKMLLQYRDLILFENKFVNLNAVTHQNVDTEFSKSNLPLNAFLELDSLLDTIDKLTKANKTQAKLLKSMADAKENYEIEMSCCICVEKRRTVVFVPCGHVICCSGCADKLFTCGVCRARIKIKIKLHFS